MSIKCVRVGCREKMGYFSKKVFAKNNILSVLKNIKNELSVVDRYNGKFSVFQLFFERHIDDGSSITGFIQSLFHKISRQLFPAARK